MIKISVIILFATLVLLMQQSFPDGGGRGQINLHTLATSDSLANTNNATRSISEGEDGDSFSFDWTVTGGIAGIQISKISYNSDTNELRVSLILST